jgi:hypothetical protein
MRKYLLVIWLMGILAIVGEIRCIYQLLTSDFKPSYKREIIYGVAAVTGVGAAIGYLNIPD